MRILFLIIVLYLTSCSSTAQNFQLEGIIEGYPNQSVYIAGFYGDQDKVIDSTKTNESGLFKIEISKNIAKGVYRILLGNGEFFDLIFGSDDIKLITTSMSSMQTLEVINSDENKRYYAYLKKRNRSLYKLDLLTPLVKYYPQNDPFYNTSFEEYVRIQDDLHSYIDSMAFTSPDNITSKIATNEREPKTNPEWNDFEENVYMRSNFFNNVDFSDTSLLRTGIFSTKFIGYLSLYQNQNFTKEQLESSFIQAVDTILKRTRPYPLVYEFALDYLIGGFEKYGFNTVIEYIAEHALLDENCEYSEKGSELEKRIETLKRLSTGNEAPDFSHSDINNKEFKLSDIKDKHTLLVFWASWCPHCTWLLPELKSYYDNIDRNTLEIVSISIDTSKADYTDFKKTGGYYWTSICDYKGWDNEVAKLYGIHATPTLILLDENRKIIAKPNSVQELMNALENE